MKNCSTLTIATLCLSAMIVMLITGPVGAGKPTPPSPPFTCTGSPLEMNNSSLCGATKWIQITDSTAACTIKCFQQKALGGAYRKLDCGMVLISWIGGTVIADPTKELGFYFDPASIVVAENTAEGMQISVCTIRDNPAAFDGEFWYILYMPLEIRDL